ncbi:hypothetical protein L1987_49615 [Smallanthus sonchifolius]|uniref:Uncharacterized protein n=1 Tax=Smallanthus sonchifolius TaxID=185202 RepID=A0ACB9FWU4_9ASTR|nr:hypothetical protein L1987_49615 [Smallanthus sonchifolius]
MANARNIPHLAWTSKLFDINSPGSYIKLRSYGHPECTWRTHFSYQRWAEHSAASDILIDTSSDDEYKIQNVLLDLFSRRTVPQLLVNGEFSSSVIELCAVSIYDYIFLWDEDMGWQHFNPKRLAVKKSAAKKKAAKDHV